MPHRATLSAIIPSNHLSTFLILFKWFRDKTDSRHCYSCTCFESIFYIPFGVISIICDVFLIMRSRDIDIAIFTYIYITLSSIRKQRTYAHTSLKSWNITSVYIYLFIISIIYKYSCFYSSYQTISFKLHRKDGLSCLHIIHIDLWGSPPVTSY